MIGIISSTYGTIELIRDTTINNMMTKFYDMTKKISVHNKHGLILKLHMCDDYLDRKNNTIHVTSVLLGKYGTIKFLTVNNGKCKKLIKKIG